MHNSGSVYGRYTHMEPKQSRKCILDMAYIVRFYFSGMSNHKYCNHITATVTNAIEGEKKKRICINC